jgi:CRP-like cAMP-binding protein
MTDWRRIFTGIQSRRQSLQSGEPLFRSGDEARCLFHLEQGRLSLRQDGITLHQPKPGELLAPDSLFIAHHDCDAVAETAVAVEVFPKAAVLLHLSAHPSIALAFAAHLARQLQDSHQRLELIRLKTAPERVIAHLTRLGAGQNVIRLDKSLMAVADELGLTHEALYRALAKLTRENRLERPGRGLFRLL